MVEVATTVLFAVAVGGVVGVLSGMLGVGGGTMLLPVFRLVFGLSATGTTGTSLFTIIPTSASGAVTHIRNKTCLPKLGVAMGVGGALTSSLGVQLAQVSPDWLVMVAAAVAIGYSAVTMLRKAFAAPKTGGPKSPAPPSVSSLSGGAAKQNARSCAEGQPGPAPHSNDEERHAAQKPFALNLTPKLLAAAVLIGAVAGLASGYIGLGGGFIMVPLMMSLLNMPMKLTSGTSLIAIMILAVPATVTQCVLGNVDYLVGIAVACGSIPGAMMGSRFMARIPERTLRFVFAGFLMFGATMLVVRELGYFG